MVKTPPFHGGNSSSSLLGVTTIIWVHTQLNEYLPYKQDTHNSLSAVGLPCGAF
ncbi:hypothetical protein CLOSBL3_13082 [Clostridiaceae bacterium BL-3]|nr:hypothetical protein CLOSBL3_13082 [Clostridiaceae bacterium BL-3]